MQLAWKARKRVMGRKEEIFGSVRGSGLATDFFRCVCKPASCSFRKETVRMSSEERVEVC
jgi:hypothetical protein